MPGLNDFFSQLFWRFKHNSLPEKVYEFFSAEYQPVLEIGITSLLDEAHVEHAYGIDQSINRISAATHDYKVNANAQETPFADESFKTIVSLGLPDMINLEDLLGETYRILKPNCFSFYFIKIGRNQKSQWLLSHGVSC